MYSYIAGAWCTAVDTGTLWQLNFAATPVAETLRKTWGGGGGGGGAHQLQTIT